MDFIKRLGSFWIIIFFFVVGGYFSAYNLDWIDVHVPHIGDMRVRAAVVYLLFFGLGSSVTVLFFGLDWIKKGMLLRKKDRHILQLKKEITTLQPDRSSLDYLRDDDHDSEADAMAADVRVKEEALKSKI
ncbi:MAG: hypothetical protein AB7T49_04315 [Oligoflexales bacterium]